MPFGRPKAAHIESAPRRRDQSVGGKQAVSQWSYLVAARFKEVKKLWSPEVDESAKKNSHLGHAISQIRCH